MAIEPIKGFYVHDEVTNTDGVARLSLDAIEELSRELISRYDGYYTIDNSDIKQGANTNTGGVWNSAKRLRYSKWVHVFKGDAISFFSNYIDQMSFLVFDAQKTYLEERYWFRNGSYVFDGEYYILINFGKRTNVDITPSDFDGVVKVERQTNVFGPNPQENNGNIRGKVKPGGYWLNEDGVAIVSPTGAWSMTEKSPILPNTTYYLYEYIRQNKIPDNIYVALYNKYGSFIKTIVVQGARTGITFDTTDDSAFVIFSGAVPSLNTLYVTTSSTMPVVFTDDEMVLETAKYNRTSWSFISGSKMGINYRGESNEHEKYPHGSKASFLSAVYHGFTAILIDVIPTSDNEWVVSHDNNLASFATDNDGNALASPWNITEHTLAEVKALDLGYKYGSAYVGTRILTLDEAIAFLKKLGVIIVTEAEIGKGLTMYQKLVDTCAKYGIDDKFIMFSYSKSELEYVKQKMPKASLMIWGGDNDTVSARIADAIALKDDNTTVYIDAFANNTNPFTESHINTLIEHNIKYAIGTPTSEPTGFLEYMQNGVGTDYVSYFGTLNIPAYKMLFDDAIN